MGLDVQPDYGQTTLSPEEREGLKIPVIQTKSDLAEYEARNIAKARSRLSSINRDIYTIEFCLYLHKRMFEDVWKWAGTFRTTDKNIGMSKFQIQTELKKTFDDLCYWLEHATYSGDEIFARFHHRLVYIHPFPNGNGRHARLYTDIALRKHGLEPFSWGNSVCDRRKEYLKAVKDADQKEFRPLIRFCRN